MTLLAPSKLLPSHVTSGAAGEIARGLEQHFDTAPTRHSIVYGASALQRFIAIDEVRELSTVSLPKNHVSAPVLSWERVIGPSSRSSTLEEQLFDALASFKVLTSHVSIHLGKSRRDELFAKMDELLALRTGILMIGQLRSALSRHSFECFC